MMCLSHHSIPGGFGNGCPIGRTISGGRRITTCTLGGAFDASSLINGISVCCGGFIGHRPTPHGDPRIRIGGHLKPAVSTYTTLMRRAITLFCCCNPSAFFLPPMTTFDQPFSDRPALRGWTRYSLFAESVTTGLRYVRDNQTTNFLNDVVASCEERRLLMRQGRIFWRAQAAHFSIACVTADSTGPSCRRPPFFTLGSAPANSASARITCWSMRAAAAFRSRISRSRLSTRSKSRGIRGSGLPSGIDSCPLVRYALRTSPTTSRPNQMAKRSRLCLFPRLSRLALI
jgi:hypothetical protein